MKNTKYASDDQTKNVDDPPRKRKTDNDLRVCTWNVRTLNGPRKAEQLAETLTSFKADLTALQEMRWDGTGMRKAENCDFYYGKCQLDGKSRLFGCGFAVTGRLRQRVLRFRAVSERMMTIRIKAKFHHISFISAHAPTEEKDDDIKESFYELLAKTYEQCPKHDIKILLGDFNAKIGREDIFGKTIGKHSLHDTTSGNGLRLIDFVAGKNMVLSSTRFPRLDIHKGTWRSPDGRTCNQIDHVAIDGRHSSSILNVRTFRGANIDSDHYLVGAKLRVRISREALRRTATTQRKFNVGRLQSEETATAYADRVSFELARNPTTVSMNPEDQWQQCQQAIRNAASEVLGFSQPPPRNPWFDSECAQANKAKTEAYKLWIARDTRASRNLYVQRRKHEKRLIRRKKKDHQQREVEEMQRCYSRKEVRNFYRRVKQSTSGFTSRPGPCRDSDGNTVVETQSMLAIWRDYFNQLLNGDDSQDPANRPVAVNLEDNQELDPPDQNEIKVAITRLKTNKAAGSDGLQAELFKYAGDDLVRNIHQLICKIWSEENMPDDWNLSTICPIHKKGDRLLCTNYRGISLINIAYKILSSVLCERLKPFAERLIGPYQCGFRPGKSTTDQIFTLRQILEKTQEFNIDTHHLFVDFKAAYDSVNRDELYRAMSSFRIPAKLIRLIRMTLENARCSVQIGRDFTETFDTTRGLRQGDALSCSCFNIVLEKVIRNTHASTSGTIFYKSTQLLGFADDIDVIGRNKRAVTGAFTTMESAASRMGLIINEDKTKYMLSSTNDQSHHRLGQNVTIDRYNFEVVSEFVYLGTAVNAENNISAEIKRRITLANRCFFGLSKQLRSKALSRRTKETLYKTLIIPVLLYGAEAWTLTQSDEKSLSVFERKVLRTIYGPVCVHRQNNIWRRRYNDELYVLYSDISLVRKIRTQRLRWLGHVERMDINAPARKVFNGVPQGVRSQGRPHLRWSDQVEGDLRLLGVRNWRRQARDRASWRGILSKA